MSLTGGCMCEGVRFEVTEPLLGALYCHCKRCQRRTGSAFSVTALTVPGSSRVTEGEALVRRWDPGDGGWIKAFCGECGSQVFTTHPENPELISIRVGALDGDPVSARARTSSLPTRRRGSRPRRRPPPLPGTAAGGREAAPVASAPQGEHGREVVGLGGGLVLAIAEHPGEAQRDAAGVARRGLDAVERDLDDQLGLHEDGDSP